ncbi:T9SS type B sorting domain-containing protein [Leptobacterium flavescens]|uniref:T9SS type B sorting domain-containing protein n=1 Tax=Leptobacterium flavescens TaxID=472055 RepID=A0A6P0UU43_9FLAO|nr:gliding motility-associated C-terminal domain-containing protein [Leptobacterium flavescens]NER15548.1 T9SS type B sorting domain-containing protein [Leptobacterium flavescens]
MKKITLGLCLLFVSFYTYAQTSLTAGDIAFLGSNADGIVSSEDSFAFVLLKDIDAATTIIFTDRGWSDTDGFRTDGDGDGQFIWTSGADRSAGDIINLNFGALAPQNSAYSIIGDQLFAIQGSIDTPVFIAGLQFNHTNGTDTNWDGDSFSNSTSALPDALENGDSALRLVTSGNLEQDNWQFDCNSIGGPISGTPAELRAILHDRSNWISSNDRPIFDPAVQAGCSIVVIDDIPPVAVCQDITVELDATGFIVINAEDIDGGSTDNKGITSFSIDRDIFFCDDTATPITVTLTVTDAAGNTDSCTATVTVEDNIAPVAISRDITVQLDVDGNASITAADIDNGSTDNCGIAERSLDISSFDCSMLGTNTVTLTITDTNNNTNTATAQVTVEDRIAPIIVTQNVSVELDANGEVIITPAMIDNGSSDNCNIANRSLNVSSFNCNDIGANTVVLTVTDASGNSSTGTAIVNVTDGSGPVILTQDISVQLDENGNASISIDDIDNGSTDNCGIAERSLDISVFDCNDIGANTVTLTITDINGNSSSGTATVNVEDNLSPIVNTRDITLQLDENGNASVAVVDIDNGSTDNCGIAERSLDISSFSCPPLGPSVVTLTVTDINGNSTSETATITITAPDSDGNGVADACENEDTISSNLRPARGFSPNNDGINDQWVIENITESPEAFIQVFDRNGREVFQARGYQNDWGGTRGRSGSLLPVGAYYYNISVFEGGATLTKGWIYINY